LRHLLDDAVKIRLRADTPVGCLLSGGLDSAAIACLMGEDRSNASSKHIFSTIHDPPYEEAAGIDAVRARQPTTLFHPDQPTAERFWSDLPNVLWHQEQPFATLPWWPTTG